jgi:hypothetical protein
MSVAATELVNVFRDLLTTDLGEQGDDDGTTDSPLFSAIPVSITEKNRKIFDPASGEQRTIRWSVGRPQDPSVDIRSDDRLVSLASSRTYMVDEATRLLRTVAGGQSLILDLRHV